MTGTSILSKIIMVTLLSLVSLFAGVPGLGAAAEPGYVYYRVQAGDSLWTIGWKFETTSDAISTLNNLKTTQIIPGQALRIPGWTVPLRPLPTSVRYTVKQGDSLYLIGQRFGVTAAKIKEASGLAGTTIYPGQNLVVPLPPQKRYTVQSGDTLALIGQKFGAGVETLKVVNRLSSTLLWVGQVLFVPDSSATQETTPPPDQGDTGTNPPDGTTPPSPDSGPQTPPENQPAPPPTENQPSEPEPGDNSKPQIPEGGKWGEMPPGVVLYHVVSGDNLWLIAQRYKTSIAAIMTTNHLHSDLLQVNQPLFITPGSTQPVTVPYPAAPGKEGFGEYMDWEYASWIFDSHNTAVIQDLETGKNFRVYRLGGSNHADIEPVTSGDTAVIRQLFGGQWSWNTRAVLVHIDGRVIAGSMAGMPHSIEDITDNDVSGHFDLHFLNSRKHIDNSIDPDHQAMVRKAAGY